MSSVISIHAIRGKMQDWSALGFYGRQLQAYYDRFPSERILVTFYEMIRTQPEEHLATVRSFLGLPAQSRRAASFTPRSRTRLPRCCGRSCAVCCAR